MYLILLLFPILSSSAWALTKEELGERLFSDVRFSRPFYKLASDVNTQDENILKASNSCLSCHQVDAKFNAQTRTGMRLYSDFLPQSQIPYRKLDKQKFTARNTPGLVGIGSPWNQNRFSHWDGEFFDHNETVLGNFTGRNMGWLTHEKDIALKNILTVLKNDNGISDLGEEFGGSYYEAFKSLGLDLLTTSDDVILAKVIDFVSAYMDDLDFEKDENGLYQGSPYDQFLIVNNLPRAPLPNESTMAYSHRLRVALVNLKKPKFVASRFFNTHDKEFGFGQKAFDGMQVFFNASPSGSTSRGSCFFCHNAPLFSDQLFHNIGTTQIEYDQVHGEGSFAKLTIPSLSERQHTYLNQRPNKKNPQAVDLGMWNHFGRTGKEELTTYVKSFLCGRSNPCVTDTILGYTVANFKTPTLRNLNHSDPYFHHGKAKSLKETLKHYVTASELRKQNKLVNGDPRLKNMHLSNQDLENLEAFLMSLNEEYE
jgi:cytochrome c peroxidase